MSGPWLLSYVILWIVVLFQCVVLFALVRELGLRALRSADGIARDGLAEGESAPSLRVIDGAGLSRQLTPAARPLLVVFGSRHCAPCRSLAPHLNQFAREHGDRMEVAFIIRDGAEGVAATRADLALEVPVYGSEDGMERFRARVTPFGFVIDAEGQVRAKGLVNDRRSLHGLVAHATRRTRRPASAATTLDLVEEEPVA